MLLAIEPGTTVSWFNSDSRPHSVTADDGSFDSGGINASFGGWSHTFTMVGRYAYHDGGDPSHTGLVIVGDAPVLTTYLPLVQAAPPLPPPLNQLMLQYPDISSAFARTALEVIPGTADDNYEAYLYVA